MRVFIAICLKTGRRGACYTHSFGIKADPTATPTIAPGFLDRVDIEKRSEAVNNREVFGHGEADTMIGKAHQGAIVTIDERISKLSAGLPRQEQAQRKRIGSNTGYVRASRRSGGLDHL